jgi:auxin efflux carrier family protein
MMMMMMTTGPRAMKLVAMADVRAADEEGKVSVAKLLAIPYTLEASLSLAGIGALNAITAAITAATQGT